MPTRRKKKTWPGARTRMRPHDGNAYRDGAGNESCLPTIPSWATRSRQEGIRRTSGLSRETEFTSSILAPTNRRLHQLRSDFRREVDLIFKELCRGLNVHNFLHASQVRSTLANRFYPRATSSPLPPRKSIRVIHGKTT